MKKAGKIIGILLLGVIIVINISTAVRNLTGTTGGVSLLPYTLLTVETGSMEPDLSAGDLIIDREMPYAEVAVGDIISYWRNDAVITHRVVRFDGNCPVTKGTANNAEDKAVRSDEYLGKVVAVLPGMGAVLSYLQNPVSLLCLLIVIFGLFYLPGIVLAMEKKEEPEAAAAVRAETAETGASRAETPEKGRKADRKKAPGRGFGSRDALRLSGFLAAASFLLLTPTMTEAKYVAVLNGSAALAADHRYMDSNLLEDDGVTLSEGGWTGKTYSRTITVKSSENLLKYNKTGQDLTYRFLVKKISAKGKTNFRTDYTLSVEVPEEVGEASDETKAAFTYSPEIQTELGSTEPDCTETLVLTGKDSGPNVQSLNVVAEVDEGSVMSLGDQICFKVYAMTSYNEGYYFCKSAEVILTAAVKSEFIESRSMRTTAGSAVLYYQFQTGLYDGAQERDVIVRWDSRELTINDYEGNAYEIIHNRNSSQSYFAGTEEDPNAYLILPLTAYTTVRLEYFKANPASDGTDIQLTAEVRDAEQNGTDETDGSDDTDEPGE